MNVLIVGAFDYGNLGDDAIRDAEIKFFKERGHNVKWDSPDPDTKKFKWSDAVVVGGGGIFYDGLWKNVINYTNYLVGARMNDKSSAVCNVGTQGINTKQGEVTYREALHYADAVTVRSPHSKEVLDTHVDVVGEDSAWYLDFPKSTKEDKIGFAVRSLKGTSDEVKTNKYHNSIEKYVDENDSPVFCFSNADDKKWLESFTDPITSNNYLDLLDKINTEYLVVSRYHALIAAIAMGITPILITASHYNYTKTQKFAERYNLNNVIYYLEEDNIIEQIENAEKQENLEEIRDKCREKATYSMEYINRSI